MREEDRNDLSSLTGTVTSWSDQYPCCGSSWGMCFYESLRDSSYWVLQIEITGHRYCHHCWLKGPLWLLHQLQDLSAEMFFFLRGKFFSVWGRDRKGRQWQEWPYSNFFYSIHIWPLRDSRPSFCSSCHNVSSCQTSLVFSHRLFLLPTAQLDQFPNLQIPCTTYIWQPDSGPSHPITYTI